MIRDLQKCPIAALQFGASVGGGKVRVWTGSDCAGDIDSLRSCRPGWVKYEANSAQHCSRRQFNNTLSSEGAGPNEVEKKHARGNSRGGALP